MINEAVRYFLKISYNGRNFSGWQVQPNANSVQQTLNEALSTILRKDIFITGSGRTDTGVHARQQFAHFDTDKEITKEAYLYKFNALLPPSISIDNIYPVRDKAHARFCAVSRSYEYYIHQSKNPFLYGFSYHFHPALDIEAMNEAAGMMEIAGRRDYACFARSGHSGKTYDCDILHARWHVLEESRLIFKITANRFLRGMVRAIVGTLLEIGLHKISIREFLKILESGDRKLAGRSVDACGLYLSEVKYPETIFL